MMLLGCARHIEAGVGEQEMAPPTNGSPAANAAGAMLSPLTGY